MVKYENDIRGRIMTVKEYWQKFIDENKSHKDSEYTAWQFGVDADELAALVTDGTKTLTCSGLKLYEIEGEEPPSAGDVSVVLGEDDVPKCIIENMKVYTVAFKDIDADIAWKEGEGDRSLEYWRQAHLDFFIPEFESMGLEFSEDEMIVVEEFKMIYK